MFMLKDDKGRSVVFKYGWLPRSPGFTGHNIRESGFYAKENGTLEQVQRAVVAIGKDVFLDKPYVADRLKQDCFDVAFEMLPSGVKVNTRIEWGGSSGFFQPRRQGSNRHFIENKEVPEADYDRLNEIVSELCTFGELLADYGVQVRGSKSLGVQTVLEMLGEGAVVTPDSIMKACAEGEDRPRLLPGDPVKVKLTGEDVTGVVAGLNKNKVSVLRQDGKKGSYAYSSVCRDKDAVTFSNEVVNELEPTLKAGFDYVLGQDDRLYRAKLEKRNLSYPMFPDSSINERVIEVMDTPSCFCPVCGWAMANFHDWGSDFECCFCRIKGHIVKQTDDEVTLLMFRMPAKNRFAIKEARCCSNCGLFAFEVGRQGKRSTGYCPYANQCLQGFNVCDYWFPRDAKTYGSNLRQHVTNLGYGVSDRRNTDRNDIRDTIYRKDDHEAEKARADRAKLVYGQAYEKFIDDLSSLADGSPLHEDALTEEQSKAWKERLDDGC